LAAQANIQAQIDNTPSLTVFIPSNAAFDAASISANTTAADLARALGGHVVQSTLENRQPIGYLPNLVNGLSLVSSAGSRLQVTVKGENYFVNDALITKANLILKNGVAHVIDRVSTCERYCIFAAHLIVAGLDRPPVATSDKWLSRDHELCSSQHHYPSHVEAVDRGYEPRPFIPTCRPRVPLLHNRRGSQCCGLPFHLVNYLSGSDAIGQNGRWDTSKSNFITPNNSHLST